MRHTFDRYIYYSLFLMYLTGGLIAFILSYTYHWNKELICSTFFLGTILVLFIPKHLIKYIFVQKTEEKKHISRFFKIVFILFLYLSFISISIFVNFKQNYYIPLEFFVIIFIIVILILSQILIIKNLSKFETYLTLIEIFSISIIVSASFLFLFPGPYGNDASYHVGFINSIITTGSIENYSGQYHNYPIYHLLFTFISLIMGIKNLKIIQFIIEVIQILFFIFIFMLTKKLFNEKVALISTLLISLSTYLLQSRYTYFPNSYTAIFFILILFLFFNQNNKNFISYSLLFIIFIETVFSHPLTPVILIFVFLIIFTFSNFLKLEKVKVSIISILFFIGFTFIWWMNPIDIQNDLFSSLILSIRDAFESIDYTSVTKATLAPFYNWIDIVLYDLGFTILIFLAIIGTFYSLKNILIDNINRVSHGKEKILILSIITLIFIPTPYILALIYPQSLPARWFPFIEIFACVFAGVSVILIYNGLLKYKLHYIVFLIISILVFFMITTPIVNPNNQIYAKELSGRSALLESEIFAGEFINSLHLQHIHANSLYIAFVNRSLANYNNFINPNDPSTYRNGLVVIRNYDIEHGFTIPLFGAKNKLLEIIYVNKQFYDFLNNSNKLYDNGIVIIYFNNG